jgi:hypothetical protein
MSYEYVKRTYGHEPIIGNRVYHKVTKEFGRIAKEKPSAGHYVQVKFDGAPFSSPCHPDELDYFPTPVEPRTAAGSLD